ncbi:hypothetical protein AX17_001572 [Amanita inopinata Kibby_2008]|nr:hypothetical protein AX17_001572 [Amanita inopinata Kibby_2008]
MIQSRRRVSYVIPPPTGSVPHLQLPAHGATRLGSVAPLLLRFENGGEDRETVNRDRLRHPRHRLGVASLALDTCTVLSGHDSPEGILYSGGRDGLVMSWELGIRLKKKILEQDGRAAKVARGRWEVMTGWADDADDEDQADDDRVTGDGDVIGDVPMSAGNRRRKRIIKDLNLVPYERQWEPDLNAFKPGIASSFRQCAQAHGDWVNDILLCNYNQTVVSGSSDGTVKAWNPHSQPSSEPTVIGLHGDYVRCVTHSREQRWVASGSFDRSIKLWDLTASSKLNPLATLVLPDASASKSSIYALATDRFGHIIASGSPERVIRLWDPRAGKRTAKLVGHTDNIRAILISEDSRYLLTGSADASIKLWSLSSQRCLHTFTHHTDSVWSLHSTHPSLEVFYSGDKSGLVCKVDVESCADVSEGECILLCNESGENASEGINKIVAIDDSLLWTASGTSSINRWRVPQRRAVRTATYTHQDHDHDTILNSPFSHQSITASPTRISQTRSSSTEFSPSQLNTQPSTAAEETSANVDNQPITRNLSFDLIDHDHDQKSTHFGIPYDSLVRLTSPNDPFFHSLSRGGGPGARGRRYADTDVATLYSAASIMSVPRATTHIGLRSPVRAMFHPPPHVQPSTQQHRHHPSPPHSHPSSSNPRSRTASLSPKTEDSLMSQLSSPSPPAPAPGVSHHDSISIHARAEYEVRELASDAIPLCSTPEFVIPGDIGLVRALTLNDRLHVLTVDTVGEVAVWDIVRGVCLGRYTKDDVAAASLAGSMSGIEIEAGGSIGREGSPREALEAVRERIEGEAIIPKWASVDTKCGVLSVHLNEGSFEAEVYADEVGFAHDKNFTDESKRMFPSLVFLLVADIGRCQSYTISVNLGKWVLRNLFIGFIREQQRIRKEQQQQQQQQVANETTKAHDGVLVPSLARANVNTSPTRHHHKDKDSISRRQASSSASPEVAKRSSRSTRLHPTFSSNVVVSAPKMIPALPPTVSLSLETRPVPLSMPLISLDTTDLPSNTENADDDQDTPTPVLSRMKIRAATIDVVASNGKQAPLNISLPSNFTRTNTVAATTAVTANTNNTSNDHFSAKTRQSMSGSQQQQRSSQVNGAGRPTSDDFSGWGGPGERPATANAAAAAAAAAAATHEPATQNTTGGLMGRLRSFGGKIKRPVSEAVSTSSVVARPAAAESRNASSVSLA